ncbi:hypothetical protein Hanom_Chr04g00374891 [Helianthus anomalus]
MYKYLIKNASKSKNLVMVKLLSYVNSKRTSVIYFSLLVHASNAAWPAFCVQKVVAVYFGPTHIHETKRFLVASKDAFIRVKNSLTQGPR